MTREEGLNNPMGLRKSPDVFHGEIPSPDKAFKDFDTPINGIRAGAKVLLAYYRNHGLNTVREIINRWAPPVENNVTAYVDHVCDETGFQPDEVLNLETPDTVFGLTAAIILHENGENPYDADIIHSAITAAYA